jgi:hypothetical protein
MDSDLLQLFARISAQRYLLELTLATVLGDRRDGLATAKRIKERMKAMPTEPPSEPSWMDPATTDLLACLIDEEQIKCIDRVIAMLEKAPASAR